MLVNQVMTRGVQCVRPDSSLQEAADRMKVLNVGSVPVCDHDRLIGIVTDRDITIRGTAAGCDPRETKVSDLMTPDVIYAYEDQDIEEVARLMEDRQVRRILVLSRDKRLVGIVALGDVAVKSGDDRLSGEVLEQVSEPSEVRQ